MTRGKRSVHRRALDPDFIRKADGRLRPAHERDIADVWAEIDRAKLQEAIRKDQKKRANKQRIINLFKSKRTPLTPRNNQEDTTRTIEIKVNLSGIGSSIGRSWKGAKQVIAKLRFSKKHWISLGVGALCFGLFIASFSLYGNQGNVKKADEAGVKNDFSNEAPQVPAYDALLPADKTIEDLGGWGRVSPPEKDPVFAYTDSIEGVQINVSQQPLPEEFKKNTAESVAKLATQFNAKDKVVGEDFEAFVGTSAQGPQSVVLTKGGLLILIKSASKIKNTQWQTYLDSLE